MSNFKLTVMYNGSRYNGWQRQGNTDNTVQAKLEAVLSSLLGHRIEINGSGRTDRGVHAAGQVASFSARTDVTPAMMMDAFCRWLPKDIAVTKVEQVPDQFHARLNAKGKIYVYRIWTENYPNVFEGRFMYHLGRDLDLSSMCHAAALMERKADFIGYSSLKRSKKSTVRTVQSISVQRLGGEVRLTFEGDGFLYNMVRIMTGTLVEVGLGRREAESVTRPFETLDRTDAGETMPPEGLTLLKVIY